MQIQNSPQWRVGERTFPDLKSATSMLNDETPALRADQIAPPSEPDLDQAKQLRAQAQQWASKAEVSEAKYQQTMLHGNIALGLSGAAMVGLAGSAILNNPAGVVLSGMGMIGCGLTACVLSDRAASHSREGFDHRMSEIRGTLDAISLETPQVLQSGQLSRLGPDGPQGVVFTQPEKMAQFFPTAPEQK